MANKELSIAVNGGEYPLEYRWQEYFYGDRSLGYYGDIFAPEENEPLEGLVTSVKEKLLERAANLRRRELRKTLPEDRGLAVLELYERSQTGEYLGQSAHNTLLYVQDVAELFGEPLGETLETVAKLMEEKKIGLNGMILISHEAYERTFELYRETNGHRRLTASDFGNWSCAACGAIGDEWEDPADTPCEEVAVSSEA